MDWQLQPQGSSHRVKRPTNRQGKRTEVSTTAFKKNNVGRLCRRQNKPGNRNGCGVGRGASNTNEPSSGPGKWNSPRTSPGIHKTKAEHTSGKTRQGNNKRTCQHNPVALLEQPTFRTTSSTTELLLLLLLPQYNCYPIITRCC